jgi:hypothetical protein
VKTDQRTLTRITPREQRYRQHDRRQQVEDGVKHFAGNLTPRRDEWAVQESNLQPWA